MFSELTVAYCDVAHFAYNFATAYWYMKEMHCRNYHIYAHDLAMARMKLECSLAHYRALQRRKLI
jgi:hypothetical protein